MASPNWLWYACGILDKEATLGFLSLNGHIRRKTIQEVGQE